MPCSASTIKKAATLAVFAAVRAAMLGCNELQVAFEKLALRLDLLSNISDVIGFDPDVAELVGSLDGGCVGGFYWVVDEMCTLLRCMDIECKVKRFEGKGGSSEGV